MLVYKFFLKYSSYLLKNCLKSILSIHIKHNSLMLIIAKDEIQHICNFLKSHTNAQYQTLVDIVVVDYPLKKKI